MTNLKYFFFFFLLILTGGIFLSLKFSYIGSDAPYYLSVARDISDGLIPYKDIYLSYTPLAMYFNALVFEFVPQPQYWNILLFQYFIILSSGALLYLLALRYSRLVKMKALILTVFYILSVLSSDGNDVILEAYSNLCVLAALVFFFKKRILWTGILLGLSVFCKQYGLLNFIPFFTFFFLEKSPLRKLAYFGAGAVIPLCIFLLYFSGYEDIPVVSLLRQLNGAEYAEYSFLDAYSLKSYLIGAKVFILLTIPVLIIGKNRINDRYTLFLLIGICVNLIPLVLQGFQHYYINTFPFLFLYLTEVWKRTGNKLLIYHSVGVLLISGLFYIRILRNVDRLEKQKEVAEVISTTLPSGNEVFLNGEVRYLYFLNNYKNPAVKEVGYSYPFQPDVEFLNSTTILSSDALAGSPDQIIKVGSSEFYLYDNE